MKTKEYLMKWLEILQSHRKKTDAIYKQDVDLYNFGEPLVTAIEDAMAFVVARDEENYKYALDLIQWWLYDRVQKKVWDADGTEHDLIEMEALCDYLIENYN